MTTVASIINDAYRETNLTALGVSPSTAQTTEALRLLTTIVSSVLGDSAGELMQAMPLGQNEIEAPSGYPWWANNLPADTFVPTNTRIMCNLTGAATVNFHPKPQDGARMGIVDVSENFDLYNLTLVGNGRSIEGEDSQTYTTAGLTREWMYREDTGNWVVVTPIEEDGEMPFPSEFDDMFIVLLALRLNPRYGQVIHPASMETLRNAMRRFSARYKQSDTEVGSELGLLYLNNQGRYWGINRIGWASANSRFNSGYPFNG